MNFYAWLAAQPPFVEVAVGVAFVLFVAPAALAAVAYVLIRVEGVCRLPFGTPSSIRLHELCRRLLAVVNEGSTRI